MPFAEILCSAPARRTRAAALSPGPLSHRQRAHTIVYGFLLNERAFGPATFSMSLPPLPGWIGPYLIWLWTLALVAAGAVAYAILNRLIRRIKEPKTRVTLSRVAGVLISLVVFVAILGLWVQNATVLVVVVGLVSAGLAFSLQGPLTSLVAWLVIVALKPFEVGDRVSCGGVAGDVTRFNAFYFSLLEITDGPEGNLYTGRQVEVPNNQIMSQPLTNFSRNFRFLWDTLPVGIYYDADWERARSLLLAVAERTTGASRAGDQADFDRFRQQSFAPRGRLEPQVFLALESTTITMTLRYLTPVWDRARTRTQLVEGILKEFAAAGIDIAYPSLVLRPSQPPTSVARDGSVPAG